MIYVGACLHLFRMEKSFPYPNKKGTRGGKTIVKRHPSKIWTAYDLESVSGPIFIVEVVKGCTEILKIK